MRKKIFSWLLISLAAVFLAAGLVKAQGAKKPPLEKKLFIHYRRGWARPEGVGKKPPGLSCYGFLSKGARLRTSESLTINPGLDVPAIVNSAQEWDDHTSTSLFTGYTTNETADWDDQLPDGRNEFSLGDYPQEGVIAVTVAWGYFSGRPASREILEFDVLFDTDYPWGDAAENSGVMDWQNIATHEIGHGLGLADVYDSGCSAVTMYGYSDYGETQKRDLAPADIQGLNELYD